MILGYPCLPLFQETTIWSTPRHSETRKFLAQRKPQKLDSEDNVPTDVANCRSYAKFCGWTQSKNMQKSETMQPTMKPTIHMFLFLSINWCPILLQKSRPTWISCEAITPQSLIALVDGCGSKKLGVPNSDPHQMASLFTIDP